MAVGLGFYPRQDLLLLDIEFGATLMAETIAYKPIRFFILTFVVTWVCWFAAPYLGDPESGDAIFIGLMLIGLLTPFATALYLTIASKNEALKKTFFNKLLNIRLIRLSSIPLFLILFPASICIGTDFDAVWLFV